MIFYKYVSHLMRPIIEADQELYGNLHKFFTFPQLHSLTIPRPKYSSVAFIQYLLFYLLADVPIHQLELNTEV